MTCGQKQSQGEGTWANDTIKKDKGKAKDRPWGLQKFEAPRFEDNRHMKVVKVISRTHRQPLPSRKYSWYWILIEAESTPGP